MADRRPGQGGREARRSWGRGSHDVVQASVGDAIDRAAARHGNFGSLVLEANAETLKAALGEMKLYKPDAG